MDWRDEGILLGVRRHGETSAIIEVLSAEHGRHAGLVRGGGGTRLGAVLQPGAQLALAWRARLEDHLGTFTVEPIRARAAAIMPDPLRLSALNAMAALVLTTLSEREAVPGFYARTVALADALADADPLWPAAYARWELALLDVLGFGLDLERCAATGLRSDLAYVSPRTGRAVSREAGAIYADRLLGLPGFLVGAGRPTGGAVREALRLSGHFLTARVLPAFERTALPAARGRLLDLLERHEIALPEAETPRDDEAEWHASVGPRRNVVVPGS